MIGSCKYMNSEMQKPIEKPNHPCWCCGGNDWWQHYEGGSYICFTCHPDPAVKKEVTEKQI